MLLDSVNRRLNGASLIAATFDGLQARSELSSDPALLALLDCIRSEICFFSDSGFRTESVFPRLSPSAPYGHPPAAPNTTPMPPAPSHSSWASVASLPVHPSGFKFPAPPVRLTHPMCLD
ncbi:hypothetical protein KEM55_003198 [Ascosphaera atra]|nr:hypothetical protein KEM55_003198 [Ascosphaera atra]